MKYIFCLTAFFTVLSATAQHDDAVKKYIALHWQMAIMEMQRTGVPASIKLAQGIHETGAGNSDLVKRSNNHFGIKCKSNWTGEKVYHDDDERGECFRSYGSSLESYKDHSNFLKGSPRYAFLFNLDPEDYKGWAFGLKKAGYATNIRYSYILISLIEKYDLQRYSLLALGKLKDPDIQWADYSAEPKVGPLTNAANNKIKADNRLPETPREDYPEGIFEINNSRVVYANAGSSLRSIARQYNISYERLLEFNELKDIDILERAQLLYLQRKRKTGTTRYHKVEPGQTPYAISQLAGLRLESLLEYNHLQHGMQPAAGQLIYLQHKAPVRPLLASEATAHAVDNAAPVQLIAYTPVSTSRHIVQTKETLYSISRKYGVAINQLKTWNKLSGDELKIGQELLIHKN